MHSRNNIQRTHIVRDLRLSSYRCRVFVLVAIGEVEVMSSNSEDIQKSVDEVQKVISALGVEVLKKGVGKLMSYLLLRNKPLHTKILARFNW